MGLPAFASWPVEEKRAALMEMWRTIDNLLNIRPPYFWPAESGTRPNDVWERIEPTLNDFQKQLMEPLVPLFKAIHSDKWRTWYTGGDDPTHGDCSGMASLIDREAGILGHRDRWNTQRFWDEWSPHFLVPEGQPFLLGDHLLYGEKTPGGEVKTWHIDIAINGYYLVGAMGGTRGTDTDLEAEYQNAFFQKRKIGYRKHDYLGALRPLALDNSSIFRQ